MKNDLIYKRLVQYAMDNSLTTVQIDNFTKSEAAIQLGIEKDELPANFENVKRLLIKDLQERDNEADRNFLDVRIPVVVKEKWPNSVLTKDVIDGKRVFQFWQNLNG